MNPSGLGLAYHGYLAVIGFIDSKWPRPITDGPPLRGVARLRARCMEYRRKLEEMRTAMCQANDEVEANRLPSYLFDPICYVPFGNSDEMYIILADDLDPIRALTTDADGSLEEISLAFCPTLESLSLESNPLFCELHSLIDGYRGMALQAKDDQSDYGRLEHGFQDEWPLLLFTKYKLDGLAVTGTSLLFQQATFKAMAKKITELMPHLRTMLPSEDAKHPWRHLVTKEDMEHTRIAFLDMQGAEEVGTLILCRNYSAAMILVSALRAMTFQDVFAADEDLKEVVCESKLHQRVMEASKALRKEPWQRGVDCFQENHIARWTQSSLAVSPSGFFDSANAKCRGFVEAISEFQVAPGHIDAVEADKRFTAEDDASENETREQDYYRYQLGIGDIAFPYAPKPGSDRFPLIRVPSFFSLVCQNCAVFATPEHTWMHGKDVVDIATTVTIPVPRFASDDRVHRLIHGYISKNHYPPLRTLLSELRRRYPAFQEAAGPSPSDSAATGEGRTQANATDISRLLPASLRQTLQYLYHNYALLLGDPYSFDIALDLYDTYATLYSVLTKFLPKSLPEGLTTGHSVLLDADKTEQISLLIEAVQSALVHRVRHMPKAYPESQMSEMAVDFRGGLNQILFAADAAVRCSLGLLRKYVLAKGKENERDRAGGLIRVCLNPGVKCCSLNLGIEHEAVLAYFEVDVAHILHIASYTDYLHEAAHLMFEALRRDEASGVHAIIPPTGVSEEQIAEVFANLTSFVFLFNCDAYKFLHYHLCTYSRSIESKGMDDCDTLFRFVELLILLFLAVDAVPEGIAALPVFPERWPHENEGMDAAFHRFENMVGTFGPLFVDYWRMWSGMDREEVRRYCRKQFRIMYRHAFRFMPQVYSGVMRIFGRYWNDAVSVWTGETTRSPLRCDQQEIDRKIREAMRDGRPIVGCLHLNSHRDPSSCGEHNYMAIDNLMLVCGLLRNYVPEPFDVHKAALHVYRNPDTGEIQFPRVVPFAKTKDQKWHDFLADRGATSMFCVNPLKRQERLKKQLVIFKTLWDISSRLRANRLIEIIDNTVGREQGTETGYSS